MFSVLSVDTAIMHNNYINRSFFCDLVLLYIMKNRDEYRKRKYESIKADRPRYCPNFVRAFKPQSYNRTEYTSFAKPNVSLSRVNMC